MTGRSAGYVFLFCIPALAAVLCLQAHAMTSPKPDPTEKPGWRLVWNDEFEGEKIDPAKWEHCPEWKRHRGHWSDEDAYLDDDGHLVLRVRNSDKGYLSGAVRTKGKFERAFGYYEMRCRMPKEVGYWVAFWLMTQTQGRVNGDGRDGTEIDIMEAVWRDRNDINHALHWDGYGKDHKSAGHRARNIPGLQEGWHTFALDWSPEEYVFSVDGVETWRTSAGGVSQVPSYIKVTAEVGDWAGDIDKATLPDYWLVDYVRVYEKEP
jgi:beta-glucanase (GH16 family)